MRILIDLACTQNGDAEQHTDTDSEAELDDTSHQGPSCSEEDDEDLERRHKLRSGNGDVNQFVGEENWLNKAAAPNIPENSQRTYFLFCFQDILRLIIQKTNHYMQQDVQARHSTLPANKHEEPVCIS
jgi:hypothetical protein